jgi:hypothetical protein
VQDARKEKVREGLSAAIDPSPSGVCQSRSKIGKFPGAIVPVFCV